MNQPFTPGQYVEVRATEHEPWEARIFHSWNEPRLGKPGSDYARVTTKGVFQFSEDAPTESFLLIRPWFVEFESWFWTKTPDGQWMPQKANADYKGNYYFGAAAAAAPFTLPPFIAPGDKY